MVMRTLFSMAVFLLSFVISGNVAIAGNYKPINKSQKPLRERSKKLHRPYTEGGVELKKQVTYYPVKESTVDIASKQHRAAPPEGTEMVTLLYEDFSKFTAGTEDEPDATRIENGWGEIPSEYTLTPGWEGAGIRQAGGVAMIDWYEYTSSFDGYTAMVCGSIITPPMDLSLNYGRTYLSFRARAMEPETGYLTITWDHLYGGYEDDDDGSVNGQVTWGLYGGPNGWGRYYIELDNCTSDCQIEIYSNTSHVLIDDIKIEKVKPDVYPPVVRKWTNYDDSGEYTTFRANWDPVEGADSYEFHVFRYYEDGIMTKKVVKELNVTDTYFDVTEKNKLDRNYTYYYYVKAKKGNLVSEESAIAMVFDIMTPQITNVYDVTAEGYTADWNSVFNADGYGFFSYLYHKATEPEEYCFLNDDFSCITSNGTMANPDVSIIGQDYLDDYGFSRANWVLYEGAYINGAIGMHVYKFTEDDIYYGELDSPIMILGGSDRKITLTADFASPAGVKPVIYLACPVTDESGSTKWDFVDVQTVEGVGADWSTHTITLTATSSICKIAISLDDESGEYYFLDNLRLSQNLKVGEYVSLPYTYTEFGNDVTTYRDQTLDHVDGDTYSCSVFAARQKPGSSWFPIYITSEESEYYNVPAVTTTSLRSTIANADKGFNVNGSCLTTTVDAKVFSATGALFATLKEGESVILPTGLWIVSTTKGASKIVIK